MTGGDRSVPPPKESSEDLRDLSRDLARDWITVWQSELATLAVDREAREAWHLMAAFWADATAATLTGLAQSVRHDPAGGGLGAAGTTAPPRPSTPAPAPDPRDAEIERLHERIAALERRLAGLERHRR